MHPCIAVEFGHNCFEVEALTHMRCMYYASLLEVLILLLWHVTLSHGLSRILFIGYTGPAGGRYVRVIDTDPIPIPDLCEQNFADDCQCHVHDTDRRTIQACATDEQNTCIVNCVRGPVC